MSESSRSSVNLDVAPGERRGQPVDPDSPFRILILGDFSGRGNRGVRASLAGRRPVLIDRDSIDDVLASLKPELQLPGLHLAFEKLDDFHPDNIYERSATFQRLAEEKLAPLPPAVPAGGRTPERSPSNLLDQMLEESGEDVTPLEAGGDLAEFLKKVVRPHLVAREDPRQKEQAARADSIAGAAMRGVLHHADFQALEAGWQAVSMLVRGLETDGDLKIYLFDATLMELAGDLKGTEELLAGRNQSWAVIVGNYAFGQTTGEVKMLGALGRMARAAGAPFLAEAVPPSGVSKDWQQLRQSPEAGSIGLLLPRFLLRLPYGKKTSPIESFDFDEMPESVHQSYLWGNPAFCCVYLLGQTFLRDGWKMRLGTQREISGLPLHTYTADGESNIKPCAEVLLTEKEADFLMEQGIMPLASLKGQDAVLLVRFQSIADPLAALAGGWSR